MATENPKITHIERVEIKGLWGKYDIDWQLNPDVNILVGINGSGKSTVLNLIEAIFDENYVYLKSYIDTIQIDGINKISICYKIETRKIKQLGTDEKIYQDIKLILIQDNIANKSNFYAKDFSVDFCKIDIIRTFDIDVPPLEALQKLTSDKVKTQLDLELYYLLNEYPRFFSKLSNRQRKEKRDDVFVKDDLFKTLVNQAFSKTNKTILINDESDIHFQLGDKTLSPYDLSSGEKQLLIILLKVLIQDNQPYILLMDEPEISLHIDWQEQLIDNIRQLNENCQIILATHSPAIFQKGHWNKITYMEDICKELITS